MSKSCSSFCHSIISCVLVSLCFCDVRNARAIGPFANEVSVEEVVTLPSPAGFEKIVRTELVSDPSSSAVVQALDLHAYAGGSFENTRFTNASSLANIIRLILEYKKANPSSTPWAVFDVDETLIDRSGGGKTPTHPNTDALLQSLVDADIPVLLLTMSSDPKPKFRKAGLKYDGVISAGLLSREGGSPTGNFIPKGKRLIQYMETLSATDRPSHVFFADDQIAGDEPGKGHIKEVVYIQSVEEAMNQAGIPFTTFHFKSELMTSSRLAQSKLDALRQNPLVPFPHPVGRTLINNHPDPLGSVVGGRGAWYDIDMETEDVVHTDLMDKARFTNVYNLEDIVEMIIRHKAEHPNGRQCAVFDVDEMLVIHSDQGYEAIHPNTNELFSRLRRQGIPIVLLSAGSGTKSKFLQAGIKYDGVVDMLIDGLNWTGQSKGNALTEWLDSESSENRTYTHIFFSDDREDFLGSVERAMLHKDTPFTTFRFKGQRLLEIKRRRIDRGYDLAKTRAKTRDFDAVFQRESDRRGVTLDDYFDQVKAITK